MVRGTWEMGVDEGAVPSKAEGVMCWAPADAGTA